VNATEYDRKVSNAIEDLEELAEDDWDEEQSAAARVVLDDLDRLYKVETRQRKEIEMLAEQVRQLMRERDAIEYQRDELLDLVGKLTRPNASDLANMGWRAGDKHTCPRYSAVHTATSKCADYAVEHGDRTYLGEVEP
jgi:hypothetical protein